MKHISLSSWKGLLQFVYDERKAVLLSGTATLIMAAGDVLLPLWQSKAVDLFFTSGNLRDFSSYLLIYLCIGIMQILGIVLFCRGGFLLDMGTSRRMKDACL